MLDVTKKDSNVSRNDAAIRVVSGASSTLLSFVTDVLNDMGLTVNGSYDRPSAGILHRYLEKHRIYVEAKSKSLSELREVLAQAATTKRQQSYNKLHDQYTKYLRLQLMVEQLNAWKAPSNAEHVVQYAKSHLRSRFVDQCEDIAKLAHKNAPDYSVGSVNNDFHAEIIEIVKDPAITDKISDDDIIAYISSTVRDYEDARRDVISEYDRINRNNQVVYDIKKSLGLAADRPGTYEDTSIEFIRKLLAWYDTPTHK